MLITRYGIPVASIQPLDIDAWAPSTVHRSIAELDEPEIDWDALELDEGLRQVLARIGDQFTTNDVTRAGGATSGSAVVSCAHLEIRGLATKTIRGYNLTRLGRRVAGELRGSSSSEPE
jgi:hypothetical protein